jgi:hypothetical protein
MDVCLWIFKTTRTGSVMAASDNVLDILGYDHVDESSPPAGVSPFDALSWLQNAWRRRLEVRRMTYQYKKMLHAQTYNRGKTSTR